MNSILHLIEFAITGPGCAYRLWRDCGFSLRDAVAVAWAAQRAYDRPPFQGPGRVQRVGRRVFRLEGGGDHA